MKLRIGIGCQLVGNCKTNRAVTKKLLKAERKAGVPVAELAEKHGISTAYIYMLR